MALNTILIGLNAPKPACGNFLDAKRVWRQRLNINELIFEDSVGKTAERIKPEA